MANKDYFIGLDMGTSSVGWAVTDTEYNLLRAKGKDMWGVRLFSEANTAADRRAHRTTRRNIARKKAREGLLKSIFEEEINKTDPGFFERLRESKYYLEDKTNDTPFVLFADKGYTDKEYYKDYPTVFHLISELVSEKGKEPHDVRLVFLACLNIFKHRGHFLNDNLSGNGIERIEDLCEDFTSRYEEYCQDLLDDIDPSVLSDSKKLADVFGRILCDKQLSASNKKRRLIGELGLSNKQKNFIEMINLTCGLTATISTIFPKEGYDEEQKKQKLNFKASTMEEDMSKIEVMLLPEEFEILHVLKRIHDWSVVSVIMGSHKYISEARVESYEKHKHDLEILKKLYKDYAKDKYDSMFREMTDNSYSAYVGKVSSDKVSQSGNYKTRKQRRGAKCNQEDFYKRIKADLKDAPEESIAGIISDMDKNVFLPKQLTNENGTIPYQLHLAELNQILENASTYLEFLNEKDENGLTNKMKIELLFSFRIPYYVGPLFKNDKVDTNAWVVRKESGRVYPWNFEDKIDKKESAEVFIERMVRHCTYLNDESALPMNSLKYERFRVLNELNNLRINGERVSPELKQRIYTELFKVRKKRITKTMLCSFLYANGITGKNPEVSGFDGTFANALINYGRFMDLFGVDTLTDKQEAAAESIIKWSTVYGDSKKFLKEKISENYGPESGCLMLDDKQIEKVIGFKFTGWGRLSKELLNLEGADKDTGEVKSIIVRMWDENYNLMELLSDRFSYKEEIAKRVKNIEKTISDIEFEDLEELYISAPVRRMTWQTLLIIKEIYQIMGYAPKKVFVEMAREEEEKTNGKGARKNSRKKKLEDLYKNCKSEANDLARDLKNRDETSLRSKKLYLYYLQKGKCMYSGETINIESLFTNDYDIDHIYPQSVVKDDSLDNNMVLVKRDYNNKKSDTYPIFSDWRKKMNPFWTMLREEGFMNDEKFKRLTRTEGFTDTELADFVNRQLVETRQATKVVAELVRKSFSEIDSNGNRVENCRVVYVKAGNVSRFRQKFAMKYDKETGKSVLLHPEMIKCRIVNDFHHANDAYLNIVVGNAYDVKFTQNSINYIKEYRKQRELPGIKEEDLEKYHMDKIFNFDIKRGKEVAWVRWGDNKSLDKVLKVMNKNTPLITRMNYEVHGGFADQTIYSAEKAKNGAGYIQIKSSEERMDCNRYGGFTKWIGTYFILVEHTKKGKRIRTIENVPLYLNNKLNTKEKLEKWCADSDNGLGLIDPSIRIQKIKIFSKIKVDGFDFYITGRSGNNIKTSNGIQLKIDAFWNYYINLLTQYRDKKSEIISFDNNIKLYDIIIEKNTEGIYSKRINSIGEILVKGRKIFSELSIEKQVDSLLKIMKVFSSDNHGIDLSDIKGSTNGGVMQINKNISDKKEIVLVNQSVTGLFESQVDLLKV